MEKLSLDLAHAAHFAAVALGHVGREYPNKPDHVLAGPEDARTPRALHPIFYGSYDWHSCVHSYWMLARLLKRFPALPTADAIVELFDRQFVADKVAAECAYLAAPEARGFKRPYGWAWLLKLAEELRQADDPKWSRMLAPLAEAFAQRFRDFLPLATYPVRVGTHFNTAFGLAMAIDYARGGGDAGRSARCGAYMRRPVRSGMRRRAKAARSIDRTIKPHSERVGMEAGPLGVVRRSPKFQFKPSSPLPGVTWKRSSAPPPPSVNTVPAVSLPSVQLLGWVSTTVYVAPGSRPVNW